MEQAIALNQAIEIINKIRQANAANRAIWQMLLSAQEYLEGQMKAELHQ